MSVDTGNDVKLQNDFELIFDEITDAADWSDDVDEQRLNDVAKIMQHDLRMLLSDPSKMPQETKSSAFELVYGLDVRELLRLFANGLEYSSEKVTARDYIGVPMELKVEPMDKTIIASLGSYRQRHLHIAYTGTCTGGLSGGSYETIICYDYGADKDGYGNWEFIVGLLIGTDEGTNKQNWKWLTLTDAVMTVSVTNKPRDMQHILDGHESRGYVGRCLLDL